MGYDKSRSIEFICLSFAHQRVGVGALFQMSRLRAPGVDGLARSAYSFVFWGNNCEKLLFWNRDLVQLCRCR